MKRWLLVLSLAACSACAPKSIQTPQGQAAYTADQIVIRLNELQNAAIQANGAGALSEDVTRKIVTFVVAADQTSQSAPLGWRATVTTGWQQLKLSVNPSSLPASLQSAFYAVDLVLGILQ